MQKKLWIGLEGMEFHAHHGVYLEEQMKGGLYLVDVFVFTDASRAEIYDELEGTFNYEKIYEVVERRMQEPVKLIERLARKILDDLSAQLAKDDKIRVKIRKLQPPLKGRAGASVVELER